MRKSIAIIAASAFLAITLVPSVTAKTAAPKKPATTVTCPVLKTKVKNPSTAPKSVYKGKTYYFCCKECKAKFDKNPSKYIKSTKQ